jgi:hypothetical protein
MKKLIAAMVLTLVAILFSANPMQAGNVITSSDSTKMKVLTDARESLKRLDIINATDKKYLSASEKKKSLTPLTRNIYLQAKRRN